MQISDAIDILDIRYKELKGEVVPLDKLPTNEAVAEAIHRLLLEHGRDTRKRYYP